MSYCIQLTEEIWTAPELLRQERGTDFQKADIFSMGIILKEVFTRSTAYADYSFMTSSGRWLEFPSVLQVIYHVTVL